MFPECENTISAWRILTGRTSDFQQNWLTYIAAQMLLVRFTPQICEGGWLELAPALHCCEVLATAAIPKWTVLHWWYPRSTSWLVLPLSVSVPTGNCCFSWSELILLLTVMMIANWISTTQIWIMGISSISLERKNHMTFHKKLCGQGNWPRTRQG